MLKGRTHIVTRKNRKRKHNPHNNAVVLGASEVERRLYGKSLLDMHTEKRLAESRKGTLIMPSLQDALQSAIQKQTHNMLHETINTWENDTPTPPPQENLAMPKPLFGVTNNVSRATFDFVRDNPGLHHNEIRHKLIDKGYKDSSVVALLSQLRRSGQIARLVDGTYHAAAKEYEPIKQSYKQAKTKKPLVKKVVAKKPEPKSEGIAALQPVHTPVPVPAQVVSNDVEYILSTLPIKQARSLYDELHKIFGARA